MPTEANEGNPSTETETQEAKYTDADIQRIVQTRLAKESKKLSALQEQNTSLQSQIEEFASVKEQLEALKEEQELAGKTAVEKEQARWEREQSKLRKELDARDKAIAERDQMIAAKTVAFQQERAEREVLGALSTHNVIDSSAAARLALVEVEINHGDDGITASYGDVIDGTVAEAITAWTKDRPMFLPAPAGGSGARTGHGASSKPLHQVSIQERMKMARRR